MALSYQGKKRAQCHVTPQNSTSTPNCTPSTVPSILQKCARTEHHPEEHPQNSPYTSTPNCTPPSTQLSILQNTVPSLLKSEHLWHSAMWGTSKPHLFRSKDPIAEAVLGKTPEVAGNCSNVQVQLLPAYSIPEWFLCCFLN